jgi:hypothetical protein
MNERSKKLPAWAVSLIVGVVFVALPIAGAAWWFLSIASER